MPHHPDAKLQYIRLANDKLLPEVTALVNEGHTVTLPLRGFSMRPFLEDGRDKALLAQPTNVGVGDAVLAEVSPGHYVFHRIVKVEGDRVTLRGDGNLATESCLMGDVKAKGIAFYRKGRTTPDRIEGCKWRTYSFVWMRLLPIRRYLLYIYRHLFV